MKNEKDKRDNKIVFILYTIASICFFISAVIGFIDRNNMAVTQLCLGVCFLCLSSVYLKKYKDENKDDKGKE